MIKYSHEEFKKVKQWFPELNYYTDNKKIIGNLIIPPCCYWKIEKGTQLSKWGIKQCDVSCKDHIVGDFLIQVNFNERDTHGYPRVYEIGEKIENLAKQLNKPVIDLHLYPKDKSCCLGISFEPRTTLSEFVLCDIYPYFVWQAYYSQYRKVPPCGEYSHGEQGLREAIKDYEENMTSVKKIGRNDKCPCESGKKYKKCCLEEDETKKRNLDVGRTRLHKMESIKRIENRGRIVN